MPARLKKDGLFGNKVKIGADEVKTTWKEDKLEEKSVAVAGYGMPTKGTYDADVGGFKVFGTVGQGEMQFGLHDKDDETCETRRMLVSVTVVKNETSTDSAPSSV